MWWRLAVFPLAMAVGCTSSQPSAPVPRADCAPVPPVVHLTDERLTVFDGLARHERPIRSDPSAFIATLRQMDLEGQLRHACSGRDTVVIPERQASVAPVLATIRATSRCLGTATVALQGSQPPVPVYGVHFCHIPYEELPEQPRCSAPRVRVDAERLQLHRVALGFPLGLGPLLDPDGVAEDPTPPSLSQVFEGPGRATALAAALTEPHAGLPNCDTASFRIDSELRWGEVAPLLATFERATGMPMVLD